MQPGTRAPARSHGSLTSGVPSAATPAHFLYLAARDTFRPPLSTAADLLTD